MSQAEGSNSDTYLHPVKMYADPFRMGENVMVMCETYKYDNSPTGTNHRQVTILYLYDLRNYVHIIEGIGEFLAFSW